MYETGEDQEEELSELLTEPVNSLVAAAASNSNHVHMLNLQLRAVRLLLRIATDLLLVENLVDFSRAISRHGRLLLRCERCTFFIRDHETGKIRSVAHVVGDLEGDSDDDDGDDAIIMSTPWCRAEDFFAGHALQSNACIVASNVYEDVRFNALLDTQLDFSSVAVIAMPVRDLESGFPIAAIEAANRPNRMKADEFEAFTVQDEMKLNALSILVSSAWKRLVQQTA